MVDAPALSHVAEILLFTISSVLVTKWILVSEKIKAIISQEITTQNSTLSSLINDQKMVLGEPLLKQFKESSSLQTLLDKQDAFAKNKLDEEIKKVQEKASKEIKGSLMKELKKLPF